MNPPEFTHNKKRQQIATLASAKNFLKGTEVNISGNKVDNYRNVRVIPSGMYKRVQNGSRQGYRYASEAADWVAMGRILEIRLGFTVNDTGIILNKCRDLDSIGYNHEPLLSLIPDNDSKEGFIQALLGEGIDFGDDGKHLL